MSLYVNLILDNERRSGSNISTRFVIQTTLSVLVALLVMGIISLIIAARSAHQSRVFAENEKKSIDPLYKSAIQTRATLNRAKTMVNFLEGWQAQRPALSSYLRGLQRIVPPNIQLTRLALQHNLEFAGPVPQWGGSLFLRGRVSGQNADADVRALNTSLETGAGYDFLLTSVMVKRFAAEEGQTQMATRVFDIEGAFKKRKIPAER